MENRIVKFRAWNKLSKEMITHIPILLLSEWAIYQQDRNYIHNSMEWDLVFDFELMQFTGLHDKNGKEIYEGDILDCQDRIVKVVWHNQAAQFDTNFIRYQSDLCSNGITNLEWKYRTIVIGNIFQNPELIK